MNDPVRHNVWADDGELPPSGPAGHAGPAPVTDRLPRTSGHHSGQPYQAAPGYPTGPIRHTVPLQHTSRIPRTGQVGQPDPGAGSSVNWLAAAIACTAVVAIGALVTVLLTLNPPGKDGDAIELVDSRSTEQPAPTDPEPDAADPENVVTVTRTEEAPAPTRPGPRSPASGGTRSTAAPAPEPEPEPTADLIRPPGAHLSVSADVTDPAEVAAVQILADHGDAINTGDYGTAYHLFTSSLQSKQGGLDTWSDGLVSSYWDSLTVNSVNVSGGTATVEARLRTSQLPEYGDGQTCSVFANTYTLTGNGGSWLISQVKGTKSGC